MARGDDALDRDALDRDALDRDALDRFGSALAAARRIVLFTGAGISTDSGIPDFRGPGGREHWRSLPACCRTGSPGRLHWEEWARRKMRAEGWAPAQPDLSRQQP